MEDPARNAPDDRARSASRDADHGAVRARGPAGQRRALTLAIAVLVAVPVANAAPTADDAPAETAEGVEASPVRIEIAGDVTVRDEVAAVVAELLGPLETPLVIHPTDSLDVQRILWPAEATAASAFVWIDLAAPEGAAVYIANAARDRVLVRTVQFETLDEAAREQIGQIVRASVEALLAGAEIGITRIEAARTLGVEAPAEPTPPPPPAEPEVEPEVEPAQAREAAEPPPSSEGPRVSGLVGGGYRVQPWATAQAPLHGPSLHGFVWWNGPLMLGGGATVGFVLPQGFSLGAIDVEVWGSEVLGWLSLGGFVGRRVALHTDVGAGLALLRTRSSSDSPNVELPPARTRALPSLAVQLGPTLWLGPLRHLVLSLRVGAQAEAVDLRFEADDGLLRFDPWRIRPTIELGAAFGWPPAR